MALQGITIHEILNQLGCRSRPDADGNYKCRCPAHDDKQESLSVREGTKGIVIKCFAGCTIDVICARLGMKPAELFWQGESEKKLSRRAAPRPKAPPRVFGSYAEAYGHLGELVCVYPYTTAEGKLAFEVARIRKADGGKTFRQHRPVDPDKGKFPIVCSVPGELSGGLIYRLPEVVAAIQAGKPVYVVEGEKDVETLRRLGLCATTCPGGAKNWRKAHSVHLKGADVIVVPDNDPSGAEHEKLVVGNSQGLARSVRAVHLADGCPELPEKGDITDLEDMVGAERALAILRELQEKAVADPYQVAMQAFNNLSGYCVNNGCICQRVEDTTKVLATFVALPTKEITRDDGVTKEKQLEIMGWAPSGAPLRTIYVDVNKYKGVDWAMENWGLVANIMPGNTVRDKLRSAIASAGVQVAKDEVVYQHTGWRQIQEKWCYLYQGGCIGADAVTVEMGPGLEGYTLDDTPEGISASDAALTSMSMTYAMNPRLSVPMLGIIYLSPLREFLSQAGCPPSFAVVLKGATGTRKSTAAALYLSHFGQFTSTNLPASFSDTANYVRSKAFYLKDMPIVVDDYYPATSREEKRQMQRIAQLLSRAFGDNRERGRLSSDLSIQRSQPPRSLGIITGEIVPDIGESGVGRFYMIDVEKGYVPATPELTDLQVRARDGELRAAMRGYIEWLAPQAEMLGRKLGDMFFEYRARAERLLSGSDAHPRTPEQVTHLMIGLTMMLNYWESLGLHTAESKAATLEEYWQVIAENSRTQAENSREDTPVQMFLAAVTEMLASGAVTTMNIVAESRNSAPKNMVGYADYRNYYFMGDTIYGAVVKFYADQERVFPGNRAELFRQLRAAGIIKQIGSDGKTTRAKRTPDGKSQRLLWIPRWIIDGTRPPAPEGQQIGMEGFKEVSSDDIPESFKEGHSDEQRRTEE